VQDFDKNYFVSTLQKTKKGVVQEDIGEPFVQVIHSSPLRAPHPAQSAFVVPAAPLQQA
jgi:hypothetical protein